MSPLPQTHSTQANDSTAAATTRAESFILSTLTTVAADLIEYNTMHLACQADRLITLTQESDIEPAVAELDKLGAPVFVLSGGSNVILPEALHASVLHPAYKGIEVLAEDANSITLEVMGGENWHELVVYTVNQGWYGLENLALIPGLVGASPVQNIGAYGVQLEDYMTHVKAFHLPTQTWHNFDKADCQFSYRDSIFKQQAGQWLITRVGFKLHKDALKVNANYGDVSSLALAKAQAEKRSAISAKDVMQAIIEIRQSKLPDPKQLPNCGSFFKNPIIDNGQFTTLSAKYPNIVGYPVGNEHTKVAAGWLIDNAGLKGKGIAPILTHKKQALVLVNHSTADSSTPASQHDILATQQLIQQTIQDQFGVALEREPVWVNNEARH
ncbi:UDP-N-acetylenolpyruvoylglucosamine reductase [Psychrobacter pasteurii]|uniref:UDP-N-acetylenolpyruvoylglucosamine reductase n=1 Tax=Psychrobacter pasteurii TaxID=1945520 RepID=A0A1R4EHP0_9GAMM|nr:UDP-N-acetylmuramate dehydrogenase [Psychrobacter pasteurii]SJM38012.1 UDP-N-acetylenolpyruvoylglucosamine reductase [Psychrobacter pasteurii]